MYYFNPKIDHIMEWLKKKIPINWLKTITLLVIILMFIDFCITGFALKMFFARLVKENHLELQNIEQYIAEYERYYEDEKTREFAEKYFDDEKMLKTFPNIKLIGKEGNIIYVSDLLKDIQPYYIRIFTPKIPKNTPTIFQKDYQN